MTKHIITLCGSRKFISDFREIEVNLTRKGFIVLSPIFCEDIKLSKNDIELFRKCHLKKIDLSDEVYIVDIDGYIGERTKKEIKYALENEKRVRYHSKEISGSCN